MSEILDINKYRRINKFDRLPYGVKVAREFSNELWICCMEIWILLSYIWMIYPNKNPNTLTIFWTYSRSVKKISGFGFKLSEEKRDLLMKKIKYLGHILDENGKIPDPTRSSAIKEIPAPKSVKILLAFSGVANYHKK